MADKKQRKPRVLKTTTYEVTDNATGESRLVDATTEAAAKRHVQGSYTVSAPDPERLMHLIRGGLDIEKAGEKPAPPAMTAVK